MSTRINSGYIKPVTPDLTQQFLDNGLYVDQEGKQLKKWWTNPQENFPNGGIFATVTQDDEPVAVGVIKLEAKIVGRELKNGRTVVPLGAVGFMVRPEYRGNQLSTHLSKSLDNQVAQTFNFSDEIVFVYASGAAQDIVEKNFENIITNRQALEQIK